MKQIVSTPRARQKKSATNHEAGSSKPGPVPLPASQADENDAPARPVDPDTPSWVRLPRPGESLRGLSRSFLYQLCAAGKLRSIVVRGELPGRSRKSKRGVRLLCLRSLDTYLAGIAAEQWAPGESTAESEA